MYYLLSVFLLYREADAHGLIWSTLRLRIFARSDDDGESWVQLGYSPAELQDPVCQGSTISSANQAALFFSNADNPTSRINGKLAPLLHSISPLV